MASSKGRAPTRTRPTPRPKAKARGRRYRRPAWYRRPASWVGASALALVVGLVVWLPNRGEQPGRVAGPEPYVGGDLHSLVVDPTGGRMYVGGHGGVAASADGGEAWSQVDSLDGADAMGWAFTDGAVLVGGHPGLFVSTDGGRSFEQRNEGLPATDIHGLGTDGTTVYASSPQVGVMVSGDQGMSWEVVTDQAGQSFMGRILVDPEDPDRLIAPDMQAGAAESADGGRTWSSLGGVPGAMWVSWDPADTQHLVVTALGAGAESTDGGETWTEIQVPQGASVVEIDPAGPETLFAGALDGETAAVWRSDDGGGTWREL